ncbi:hypothetical protein NKH24_30700, partial [Mesorhizobium sp. M1300]
MITHRVEVEGALLPEAVMAFRTWLRDERGEGRTEFRRRLKRRKAERVRQHQAAELATVLGGKASSNCGAENLADKNGRCWAGAFDEFAKPRENTIGNCQEFCARGRFRHWLTNLSPKTTANWV